MMILALSLTVQSHTSLLDAMKLPRSVVAAFFESKPLDDHRNAAVAEAQRQIAVIEAVNGVIRGLGAVIKTISRVRIL